MTIPDTGQDGGQDNGVDIATAAARLGISKEAVRKKIARGTLRAVKAGGLWRVILPGGQDAVQDTPGSPPDGGQAAGRRGYARPGQDALVQALQARMGSG